MLRIEPTDCNAACGVVDGLLGQGRYLEALEAIHEAIRMGSHDPGLFPGIASALLNRCKGPDGTVSWDQAAVLFAQEIDRLEDGASANANRKALCRRLAQWDELFNRVAGLRPQESTLWIGRGQFHASRFEWKQAAEDYAKIIDARPIHDNCTFEYAGVLLLAGDTTAYENFCRQLVDKYDVSAAYPIARSCAIGRTDAADPAVVVQWAKQAIESSTRAYSVHTLALAQFRAGEIEAAIETAKRSSELPWSNQQPVLNSLLLAILHDRLGDNQESRRYAELTTRMLAKVEGDLQGHLSIPDWIELNLLLRESEALFTESPIAHRKPQVAMPIDQSLEAEEKSAHTQ
jgi:tetratricopeptide (TPR) repeat protein